MFEVGGKVLAYHGLLIYEAKICKRYTPGQDVETEQGPEPAKIPDWLAEGHAYFLHYKGWNSKWDEWVPRDRIMEINEELLQLQKDVKLARKRMPVVVPKKKTPEKVVKKDSRSKKPQNSDKKRRFEVSVPMSPRLMSFLVDDWEFITKDRKVVQVPTKMSVTKIVEDYWKANKRLQPEDRNVLREYLDGLVVYFNQSLGLILLYRSERLQYLNLLKQGPVVPADTYGIEHLLRLFSALPGLVAETGMDNVSLTVMGAQLHAMMEWIEDNLAAYANEYDTVTPSYDRLSRS